MIISEIQENELETTLPFIRKTFQDTYEQHNTPENMELYLTSKLSDDQLTKEYKDSNCLFYKGEINSILISYLKLNINESQTESTDIEAIEIERIYVDKSYIKKGHGASLIKHAIQVGKNLEKSYIWLGVWEKNINAIGFYENMGFEVFSTHDFFLGSEHQRDFLMKMNL